MHCMTHSLYTAKVQPTRSSPIMKPYHLSISVTLLIEITACIRNSMGISRTLNGSLGHVFAKTVNSFEMFE